MTIDDIWPVDPEYSEYYWGMVKSGREVAAQTSASIVAICRNAAHALPYTLVTLDSLHGLFKSCKCYVFENDSADGSAECLDYFAGVRPWFEVKHETLGGIDSRGFEPERTERLAYCRNKCLEWVRRNPATWTIVLDTDPAGGFSIDGVMNSIAQLGSISESGAMASYSLYRKPEGIAHYDAWAARPNWWRDRRNEIGMTWFSAFLPPVGSPPVAMNSAFGGLCVYRTEAFLSGRYSGEDCEHVPHHRRIKEAGWQLYLNPGCRYIAVWDNDETEDS